MKHKFGTILLILVLVFGFMTNVNAETKIKESASDYVGDVYIIGSSRFDSSIVVTGTMATVAGAREAYIQYVINNNYEFKPEEVRIYYYSELAETWSVLPATSEDVMTELNEEQTEELTENLNIYYVNEEEKVLEIPYNLVLEDGYELKFETNNQAHLDKVSYEDGKLKVPATAQWVEVYATKESETPGEEPEEIYLGDVIQDAGVFEQSSAVRTVEQLLSAIENGVAYIQLEADLELEEGLVITKELVLDLNGKTLKAADNQTSTALIKVEPEGHLIVGNGTINSATEGNNYSIALWARNGGEITIVDGTYTNVGAKAEDNGVANNNELIYASGGGKITIYDGTFVGNTENAKWGTRYTLNLHDGTRDTSAMLVMGGTYTGFNPADNLAEGEGTNFVVNGYKVVENNGIYTVVEFDAENVTDEAELRALMATNGTVKLGADLDLTTAVHVTKEVVLNLNNHKLTVKEDTVGDGVFYVPAGGKLTINGEGTIDGLGKNDYSMAIWANGGEVIINGGTYTNVGAGDEDHYDLIYAKNGGKVTINGGNFIAHTPVWTLNLKDNDGSKIEVKGGTFTDYNPANADSEPTKPKNFVANGYKVVENNGIYTVAEFDAENVTDEAELRALMATNGTVKLGADLDLTTAVHVTKEVVLNLNNHKLTVKEDTVGDGVFYVPAGGKLTINGEGTIDGLGKNDYSMAIWANGGEVIINGGTYTNVGAGDEDHYDLIYAKNGGKVTINGGNFIAHTPVWTLNLKDNDGSKIEVKGGTFTDYNPATADSEPTKPKNFVANGYKVVESSGKYTVTAISKDDVAVVNGIAYQDLQTALDAANNGEKVVLVNDIDYKNCDTTPLKYQAADTDRRAVLDLNGKTVSAVLNNDKIIALLAVGSINADKNKGTATLTIEDSSENMTGTLTIMPTEASSAWTVAVETVIVERSGRLIVNGGNIITDGGDANADNPYGILVLTNTGPQTAELTINGGYIESRSSTGMGVRVAANSETGAVKFTLNGGTIVGADNGRGVWLQHMAGNGKHQLIEATINGGRIIADRALEVGDFNKDTDVAENIQITINGGNFQFTNVNNNTTHPDCADITTSMSETYYNMQFTHVKVVDNR